jgi:hypothetical protein
MTRSALAIPFVAVVLSSLSAACNNDSGGDGTTGAGGSGAGATGGAGGGTGGSGTAGSSATGGSGATGGSSAAGGSGATGGSSAGGSSAGGSSAGGSGGAAPTKGGVVNISTQATVAGMYANSVVGTFFATLSTASTSACTTTTTGSCTVSTCDFSGAGGSPASPTLESAGTLTVTGASVPISITPNAMTQYLLTGTMLPTNAPLYVGTEMLTIAATGAAAPAFSAQLAAPASIKVSQPASGALTINKSQDLALAWTSGTAGMSTFTVSSSKVVGTAVSKTASVACTFPANSGSGTIPSSQLQQLSFVDVPTVVSFQVITVSRNNFVVDSSEIVLQATAGTLDAAGNPFKSMPTLN